MVCVFTTSTVEMIAMIAELRMTCSSSDLSAARLPDASRAGREFFPQVDHTHNRGVRGRFTMLPRHYGPTGSPPNSVSEIPSLHVAHRRWSREVGQESCAGLVGIIWRLLRPFRYLIGTREPARGRARPMASGRTRVTSRPTRALAI
jgi:hypothetical protein